MSSSRRFRPIIIAVAAAGLLAACSSSSSGSDSGGSDPIVLGLVLPVTKVATWGGEYETNGVNLAVDEINKAGGLLGHQIKVEVKDGQCDPEVSATAMVSLLEDKPFATMGAFCGAATLAILPENADAEVPNINNASLAPEITDGSNKFSNRTAPTQPEVTETYAQYLADEVGAKKIFQVYEQTGGAQGEEKFFKESATAHGMTVESIGVETTIADFSSIVTRATQSGADFVVLSMTDGNQIKFMQAAAAQGLSTPVGTMLWASPTLFTQGGPEMDGLLYMQLYLPDASTDTVQTDFTTAYKAKYGSDAYWPAATAYDAVHLLKIAAESANSVEPGPINDALKQIKDFDGVSGKFSMDDKGQASFTADRLLIAKWDAAAGKAVVVYNGGAQ